MLSSAQVQLPSATIQRYYRLSSLCCGDMFSLVVSIAYRYGITFCTPKTNVTLCVNCTSVKKKKKFVHISKENKLIFYSKYHFQIVFHTSHLLLGALTINFRKKKLKLKLFLIPQMKINFI